MYDISTLMYYFNTFKYLDFVLSYMQIKTVLDEPTLFMNILGDSPKIRVLDLLLTGRKFEYTISDIAERAAISRSTFYAMMDQLLKLEIIIATRKIGHTTLYQLNTGNSFVKELITFYDTLLKEETKKELGKYKANH